MGEQLLVAIAIGGPLLILVSMLLILKAALREVPSGSALVIRSLSGEPKVRFDRGLVIPLVQSAELLDISAKRIVIERSRSRGLRCRDGIRASLRAVFIVRVNPTEQDVNKVRARLSAASLASAEFLRELFADSFTQALEHVIAQLDFEQLTREQEKVKEEVIDVIGSDLAGFVLESLSLTNIEMVPASELNPEDPGDAQGIRKITEMAAMERTRVAEIDRQLRTTLAKLELDEREILLTLQRHQAELSRMHELHGGPVVDIDQLRAGLDERIRQIVRLVQSQS